MVDPHNKASIIDEKLQICHKMHRTNITMGSLLVPKMEFFIKAHFEV